MLGNCIEKIPTNLDKDLYLRSLEVCESHDKNEMFFVIMCILIFALIILFYFEKKEEKNKNVD